MSKLTIVATFQVHPDRIDHVRSEMEKVIPPTRAEAGCLQYDLHQDHHDPGRFLFYENWESREHWQAHMKAPHLLAFREAVEGAVAEVTIHEMSHIA